MQTEADLLHIRLARSTARILTGAAKNREKDRGKNRDDGYNDEQFDQSERAALGLIWVSNDDFPPGDFA
jgi:hypothetical protein